MSMNIDLNGPVNQLTGSVFHINVHVLGRVKWNDTP